VRPARLAWEASDVLFDAHDSASCMDNLPSGDKNGELREMERMPEPDELRGWTWESQFSFRQQRLSHWRGVPLLRCQAACRARRLWPGGQVSVLRHRLVLHEFDPAQLQAADWLQHWQRPPNASSPSSGGERSSARKSKGVLRFVAGAAGRNKRGDDSEGASPAGQRRKRRLTDSDSDGSDEDSDHAFSLSSDDEGEVTGAQLLQLAGDFVDDEVPGDPLPQPSLAQRCLGDALNVYTHLQIFHPILRLTVFSLEQFLCALASGAENKLLSEIHLCALRLLMAEPLSSGKEDFTGQQDHFLLTWISMNGLTWPEHLRRFAAAQAALLASRGECTPTARATYPASSPAATVASACAVKSSREAGSSSRRSADAASRSKVAGAWSSCDTNAHATFEMPCGAR